MVLKTIRNLSSQLSLFDFRSELFKKSTQAFALTILGKVAGLIFFWSISKSLGAEKWGLFVLGLMLVEIIGMISRFGQDTLCVKLASELNASELKNSIIKLFKQLFKQQSLFNLPFGIALFFLAEPISSIVFKKPDLSIYLQILAISIPIRAIYNLQLSLLRSFKRIDLYSFYTNVSIYAFATALYFISSIFDLKLNISFFYLGGLIISILLVTVKLNGYLKDLRLPQPLEKVKLYDNSFLFKTGFQLMLASSLYFIMQWTDTFFLGVFRNSSEVGVYNICFRLSTFINIILVATNSILGVKIAEFWSSGKKAELQQISSNAGKLIFYCTIPLTIFLIIFSKPILGIFGDQYIIGSMPLILLTIGNLINAMCGGVGIFLQMSNNQKLLQNLILISTLMNIGLNILLVPKWGMSGAAFSSMLASAFWNIYALLYIFRKENLWLGFSIS